MADNKSKGRRTKSKGKGKKRQREGDRDRERDRPATLPRLDREPMEKVPSNAPTMAIAPSDYEHIFHEGPAGGGVPAAIEGGATTNNERSPPPPAPPPPPPPTPPAVPAYAMRPPPPPPPLQMQGPGQGRAKSPQEQPAQDYMGAPPPPLGALQSVAFGRQQYAAEVQVTPDGYTMLGHTPDTSAQRRVALPPHIVRASNQFSRAALSRVAKFLASRADPPR